MFGPLTGGNEHLHFFSESTQASLTYTLYELVRHPEQISRLRQEIASHVSDEGNILYQDIRQLKHLNGVISETMRLHPPIGTGLQRVTPSEGTIIGDMYIPGNITISCPQYVIGRSKSPRTAFNSRLEHSGLSLCQLNSLFYR